MSTSTTQTETLGDNAQLIALINPIFVTRPYVSYLTSNAGLVTSLADLGSKINDGTVTNNDYIDVLKDLGAFSTSFAALLEAGGLLAAGTVLPWAIGIGLGLAVLDYADEHNYDASEIYEDLKEKMSMLENYMNGGKQDGGLDPTADSDNDGIPDYVDPLPNDASNGANSTTDSDNDGIPDYLDPFPDEPAIPEGTISIEVSNAVANEGDSAGQSAQVKVSLSSALLESIHISLSNGGYVEIPAGSTSADATIMWNGDTIPEADETIPVEILGFSYGGAENVVFGHDGSLSIVDDDKTSNGHPMDPAPIEPPRRDPLVLDMDKDGFISTVSLEESTAYFDLTIRDRLLFLCDESFDGLS